MTEIVTIDRNPLHVEVRHQSHGVIKGSARVWWFREGRPGFNFGLEVRIFSWKLLIAWLRRHPWTDDGNGQTSAE